MQPDPACPPPLDKDGNSMVKPEGPRIPSLVQGGPDFAKPPTPTFNDTSKCVHSYVSPNSDLMQPDPECPGGDPKKQ
jgi:hypothetical protein